MEDGWPWEMTLDAQWYEQCAQVAAELVADAKHAFFVIDADGSSGPGGELASGVSVAIEQHLPGPDGTGRAAYIGDMATHAAYRGRGYGSALLQHAMDWAREQGAGWASLFSTESGRHIYLKAGFDPKGPFEHMSIAL